MVSTSNDISLFGLYYLALSKLYFTYNASFASHAIKDDNLIHH